MTERMACGLAVVLLLASTRVGWAQSLVEVAKKEAERRKSVSTPAKVYTNDDLSKTAPLTTAAGSARPAGAQPAPSEPAAPEAAPEAGQGEKYWRERIEGARQQLERTKLFEESLQSRVNALWADFTARDDPAQRSIIERERQKALAELERVKSEIKAQTQAIADIEEEARRAGVPPGWLRD